MTLRQPFIALVITTLLSMGCQPQGAYDDPVGPLLSCVNAAQGGQEDAESVCLGVLSNPGCRAGFEACARSYCAAPGGAFAELAACQVEGPVAGKDRFVFFVEILALEYDVEMPGEALSLRLDEETSLEDQRELGRLLVELRQEEELSREARAVLGAAAFLSDRFLRR